MSNSDLDWWSDVGAIVGGTIATLAFLGAVVQWFSRRHRRPTLRLECGNGPAFRREIPAPERHGRDAVTSCIDAASALERLANGGRLSALTF